MPELIFDTCCCCMEVKTGCFILGYLNLVGEIILSILVLVALVAGGAMAAASDDEDKQKDGVGAIAIGVGLLLVLAFLLAFTITLLVGLHKNKRGHVKAYLNFCGIILVLGVIWFFASFIGRVTVLIVSVKLIFLLLHVYVFLVIRSQYYKMDDPNNGAIYNTA